MGCIKQHTSTLVKRGLLSLLCVSLSAASAMAYSGDSAICQQVSLPVSLSLGQPANSQVVGWLCWRMSTAGRTVQVLSSGGTYDHNYWDFPLQPDTYSYVSAATSAGYVTFNYDRIGTGLSSHPAATSVTLASEAYVLSQIIQALHAGTIGSAAFAKVISVGHSLGSAIAMQEAASYGGIDGLIVTGFGHVPTPGVATSAALAAALPAQLDAKFMGMQLPLGYTTSIPNTRGTSFYNTSYADSNIIARDEQLKQTATAGEVSTFSLALNPTLTQQVQVPVLTATGQNDQVFCNESLSATTCASSQAYLQRETGDYSTQACLEAYVQPQAGHDMALHPNAQDGFNTMIDWANRRVGFNELHPPTEPCAN